VHVVLGEMVPKNLSLAASTKAALLLVPPLQFFVTVTRPLVVFLNTLANLSVRAAGVRPKNEIRSSFDRDEVAGFVKESHREGFLSTEEEHLLSGTLDFEDYSVKRVVLPPEKLVLTKARPTAVDIEKLCAETGFSRFLVPGPKGRLRGYVHIKDVLAIADDAVGKPLAATLIRPLTTARPDTTLRQTLKNMQQSGSHVAQVVGARGKLLGVAMLEDVIEELVGTIKDDTRK
jgi:CBS domain containing-hemolysin-like protein